MSSLEGSPRKVATGVPGVEWTLTHEPLPDSHRQIQDHELNLGLTDELGLEPVNFNDVLKEIARENLGNIILFDSPPDMMEKGNFWRVLWVEKGRVQLQFCDYSGKDINKSVEPFCLLTD